MIAQLFQVFSGLTRILSRKEGWLAAPRPHLVPRRTFLLRLSFQLAYL